MTASLQDRRIEIGGKTYTIRVSIKFFLSLQERWELANDTEVRAAIPDKAKNMRGMVDIVCAGNESGDFLPGEDPRLSRNPDPWIYYVSRKPARA